MDSLSEAAKDDEMGGLLFGVGTEAATGGVVLGAGTFTEQAVKPNTSNPAKNIAFFMGKPSIKVVFYLNIRLFGVGIQNCKSAVCIVIVRPCSAHASAKYPML